MNALRTSLVLVLAAACGDQADRPTGLEPTIVEVTPATTGLPGGATGTITGANFLYADAGTPIVVVGGIEVAATVVDDATITFTVPPGDTAGEAVDVAVFNGNGYAMAADVITYNDPPVIFDLSATHGAARGGEVVTIHGRGFAANEPGATLVTFGAATTDEVTIIDDATLEVAVPARADADAVFRPLPVTLANANGDATAASTFVYTTRALMAFGNNRSRKVFVIDPTTYAVTDTGITSAGLSSYAVDDAGQAWAVGSNPRTLMQFDPFGTSTAVGNVNDNGQDRPPSDLVLIADQAFTYSRVSSVFGSLDLTTAAFSQIGTPLGLPQGGVSLALGYRNPTSVFMAQRLNEPLRAISTLSGTVTNLAQLDGPAERFAHGITTLDGITYLIAHDRQSTSWLYAVDTDTGALTELATVPAVIGAIGPTPPSYE